MADPPLDESLPPKDPAEGNAGPAPTPAPWATLPINTLPMGEPTPDSLPSTPGHVLVEALSSDVDGSTRYRLSRLHAEGGLGRVWIAQDVTLQRDVALKELKRSTDEHSEISDRFMNEAQITGQLEHPNIVPVYELGRRTETMQPFYTMRLVRGQTLHAAILAHHAARKANNDDPLRRVRLLRALVSVCNAISYAHSRGIIHRDLKPANIVLGDFGEVVVLDWGLAKRVGDTDTPSTTAPHVRPSNPQSTAQGQVLGTPAYMAPEQAAGRIDEIDATTDIYGLGAILFETLTGAPPHRGASVTEVLDAVVSLPTPEARAQDSSVPRALNAICAKAMAKDKPRRYTSATHLAEDLERFLADEPVAAYRESWQARAGRWFRRHRAIARTGAAALVIVTAVSIVATLIVDRARNETVVALEQTETARNHAQRNFATALDVVNTFLTQVSDDPRMKSHGLEQLRQELLVSARDYFETFVENEGDSPELIIERGYAYLRLAEITGQLGKREAAIELAQKAQSQLRPLPGSVAPTPKQRAALAGAGYLLGRLQLDLLQIDTAEANLIAARDIYAQLEAFPATKTASTTTIPAISSNLAVSHADVFFELARIDGLRSQYQAAEAQLTQGLTILRQAPPPANDLETPQRTVMLLTARATARLKQGRVDDARRDATEAVQLLANEPRKTTLPELAIALAGAHELLGKIENDAKQFTAAQQQLNESLQVRRALTAAHPDVPDFDQSAAETQLALGTSLFTAGDQRAAEGVLKEVLQQARQLVERHPGYHAHAKLVVLTELGLGMIYRETGEFAAAEKHLRSAREQSQQLSDKYPRVLQYQVDCLGAATGTLALIFTEQARYADAEEYHREVLELADRVIREYPNFPEYRSARSLALSNAAMAEHACGQDERALELLNLACQQLDQLVRDCPAMIEYRRTQVVAWNNLAIVSGEAGQSDQADRAIQRAVNLGTKLLAEYPSSNHRGVLALAEANHGLLQTMIGKPDEAIKPLSKSIALYEQISAAQPHVAHYRRELAIATGHLADAQARSDDQDAAEKSVRRSCELIEALARDFPDQAEYQGDLVASLSVLGDLLGQFEQADESRQVLQRAVAMSAELAQKYPDVPGMRHVWAGALARLGLTFGYLEEIAGAKASYEQAIGIWQGLAKSGYETPSCMLQHAQMHMLLGAIYSENDELPQAFEAYRLAIEMGERGLLKAPRTADLITIVMQSYGDRATLFIEAERYSEALADLDHARQIMPAAEAFIMLGLRVVVALKAQHQITQLIEDHRALEAAQAAESLARVNQEAKYFVIAAQQFALRAAKTNSDTTLDAAVRGKQADDEQVRAVKCLHEALAAGAFKEEASRQELRDYKALVSLRDRPDFKAFLEQLDKPK